MSDIHDLGETLQVSKNDDVIKDAAAEEVMAKASDNPFGNRFSLAMSYIISQPWDETYDFDVALFRGTLFPSLDKPFLGMKIGGKNE